MGKDRETSSVRFGGDLRAVNAVVSGWQVFHSDAVIGSSQSVTSTEVSLPGARAKVADLLEALSAVPDPDGTVVEVEEQARDLRGELEKAEPDHGRLRDLGATLHRAAAALSKVAPDVLKLAAQSAEIVNHLS